MRGQLIFKITKKIQLLPRLVLISSYDRVSNQVITPESYFLLYFCNKIIGKRTSNYTKDRSNCVHGRLKGLNV